MIAVNNVASVISAHISFVLFYYRVVWYLLFLLLFSNSQTTAVFIIDQDHQYL